MARAPSVNTSANTETFRAYAEDMPSSLLELPVGPVPAARALAGRLLPIDGLRTAGVGRFGTGSGPVPDGTRRRTRARAAPRRQASHRARLFADPTRARLIGILMAGSAHTRTELAQACGVAPSTMSGHLDLLTGTGAQSCTTQVRHRCWYVRCPGGLALTITPTGAAGIARLIQAPRCSVDPQPPVVRDASSCAAMRPC